MRNRGSLALMELTVMVLIFALAAAGCLRCFVWAKLTSEEIDLRDQAAALARNTAEAVKTAEGNEADALALVTVPDGLELKLTPLPREIPGLGEMEIVIEDTRGETLFSLTAAWQEETP